MRKVIGGGLRAIALGLGGVVLAAPASADPCPLGVPDRGTGCAIDGDGRAAPCVTNIFMTCGTPDWYRDMGNGVWVRVRTGVNR